MSDRDTAALRDSVIEQMDAADDPLKHSYASGHGYCICGVYVNDLPKKMTTHRHQVALDAALAVTACTTCGNGIEDRFWFGNPCPVRHGTPPRALRWASDYEQVGDQVVNAAGSVHRRMSLCVETSCRPVFVLTECDEQEGP